MTRQRELAKRRPNGKNGQGPAQAALGVADAPHELHEGGPQANRRRHGNQTLLRLLERAREERGSPSMWDAVAARLDAEDRQRKVVAPMSDLLHRIQERVDDTTWGLVLELEMHFASEVMAGVETGIELGYEHGRAMALLDAERVPGNAARALTGRLADLLGDTEADYLDVVLALLATLETTVKMAHGGPRGCKLGVVGALRTSLP